MGGLRKHLPYTYGTFLVATIAIAGIFPTSGFASKDEILARALMADPSITLIPGPVLYALGFIGALITTFYMFRLVFLTFWGEFRGDEHTHHHLHESPWSMTVPLLILAALSAVGGLINWPALFGGSERLHHWLGGVVVREPHWQHLEHSLEYGLVGLLHVLVFGAIYFAYHLYVRRPEVPERLAGGVLYRLSLNKYYVDEIYQAAIIDPLHWLSRKVLWPIVDVRLIDGTVNGVARLVQLLSSSLGRLQSGQINTYAFSIVLGMVAVLSYFAMK